MICESCKNSIPETAKFCPRCGNTIESKVPAPAEERQDAAVTDAPVTAAPVPESSASGGSAAAVSQAPVKDETAGGDDKPKSGSKLPLIIVLVVLLLAIAAGGYYYYDKYLKKAPQQTQVPGVPSGQMQPGSATVPSMGQPAQPSAQPGSPVSPVPGDQYQPPPQARTRVAIKASALATNFKKGRPVGFASNFRYGSSRVVHYVQYARASVGRTTFSTQYYQNGRLLFKCGPSPMQYVSGKYFCRPQQDLTPGSYEVKFFVDGAEEQTLKFNVSY